MMNPFTAGRRAAQARLRSLQLAVPAFKAQVSRDLLMLPSASSPKSLFAAIKRSLLKNGHDASKAQLRPTANQKQFVVRFLMPDGSNLSVTIEEVDLGKWEVQSVR